MINASLKQLSQALAARQISSVELTRLFLERIGRLNPTLNAFILVGGWAQFGPQAYAQVTDQVMPKLKSKQLIIIAGDTLPPQLDALKNGRSHAQIGQRPFEMGHRAPAVLIDLINGKKIADPLFTGLDECVPGNLGKCPAK